jgi:uncharacterized protein YkwD
MRTKQPVRLTPEHKKRLGLHHTHGKHYVKVYWPYMPLLLIIGLGMLLSLWPSYANGTLAYATNLSHSSLLAETNEERTANGSNTVVLNDKLNQAAQVKANDMVARDYWSHNTPDGKEPWTFVVASGYEYKKAGENLAYGFSDSEATIRGWMNSPSHRANLLDVAFSEVGFGYANANDYQGKGEVTIVVAMYGNPLYGPVAANTPTIESETAQLPVTTNSPITNQAAIPVSRIDMLTNGQLPWLTFAVGLMSGVAMGVLILKHSLALHKLVLQGEAFFLHHPLLDAVLITLVILGLFLNQTTGFLV